MARPGRIEAVLFDFDGTLCDTESKNLELVDDVFFLVFFCNFCWFFIFIY